MFPSSTPPSAVREAFLKDDMSQDQQPKTSLKDKIEGVFHHSHKNEDQSAGATSQPTEQTGQTAEHKESFGEKAKEYIKEDEKREQEGKEYGGLM